MRSARRSLRGITALLALAVSFTLIGCYKHTINTGRGAPAGTIVYDDWENFWLAGLIGQVDVDVREICPSGNATVEVEQSFLNGFVAALTGSIYSPSTLRVRCDRGRPARVELSERDVATIVGDPRFLEVVREEIPERLPEAEAAQRALNER